MTPGRARVWIGAARLRTLPAAIVPVVVGTACACATRAPRVIDPVAGDVSSRAIAWRPALAALAGALAIQIGTNFANDVFDAERGADGADRIGPVRAVSAGLVTAGAMKRAMVCTFAIACAFGAYLVAVGGWPIAIVGIASIAAGIAYTGGPWPLGYHGLGDATVFVAFGLVAVCGTAYVELGAVPALAIWAAVPVGALATAILVVNNLRDRVGDARAGKRTLAVRLGRRGALVEYTALLAIAYAAPIALAVARGAPWCALPVVSLPLAARDVRAVVAATTGVDFNRSLASTARLLLVHGVLLATGVAV
ncbi:MAG TPA: 1,4-dihydroxy-2-naphthoate polyprenyltransferase [Kofleriaceae bacterium]|nr:1,4-dihydroxy-2-naphthoate polyprenyltransferase [Kofleriaceae bacterium]